MNGITGILTQEERTELISAVASLTEGDYRKLKSIIPEHHVMRIEKDSVPEEYAFNVIRYCELSAWVENPALIISLLQTWSFRPLFSEAIQRIRTGEPPRFHIGQRIWDPFGLAYTLPFINRKETRRALEAFLYPLISRAKPPGMRVLIVNGAAKSGKTFTYEYIRYTKSFLTDLNFKIVFIDFKKVSDVRLGPMEFAKALLNQINPAWMTNIDLRDVGNEAPSRWIKQLCSAVAEQIAVTSTKCIIVLDNFFATEEVDPAVLDENTHVVPAETLDMISGLADIATGKEEAAFSGDFLRLVLLGYNSPINNFMARLVRDDIKPLNRNDLEAYFMEYALFHQKTLDAEGLELLIDETLSGDDPNDPRRTEKLAQRALTLALQTIYPADAAQA